MISTAVLLEVQTAYGRLHLTNCRGYVQIIFENQANALLASVEIGSRPQFFVGDEQISSDHCGVMLVISEAISNIRAAEANSNSRPQAKEALSGSFVFRRNSNWAGCRNHIFIRLRSRENLTTETCRASTSSLPRTRLVEDDLPSIVQPRPIIITDATGQEII